MKIRFFFISFLLLLIFYLNGFSDNKDVTNDMFGLEMRVIAPFPDAKDDGIEMDTVRYGHIISVQIKYKNLTDVTQRDFEISAFFPNRFESYTTLISWNRRPDYADHPDSSIQATWKFDELAPTDSGEISFSLIADRAPKDTIYLSYDVVARAKWTPVSQISRTNIYVPGGQGISPYPNLYFDKKDNLDEVFPGDTINYTIRFGNIGEIGGFPANGVAIFDTLPAHFILIENQYSPPIDTLPDGRFLLIWDISHIVPYSFNDSVQFKVKVDLIADRDSLVYNCGLITSSSGELELINNRDKEPVLVKPKIDLAIVQEGDALYRLFRDESQNFDLKCKNLSSLDLDNITVIVKIDDGIAGTNIYSLQNTGNGQVQTGDTKIQWTIPFLAAQDSTTLSFGIIADNINRARNYTINFNATIDSVVLLADGNHSDIDTSNNHDEWVVQVDATPDLAINIIPDKDSTFAKETCNFKLICSNSSISATDSIGVRVYIDDTILNSNIYSLSANVNNGLMNADTTLISWKIPPLNIDERKELNFALLFNQIKKPYRDYPDFKIIATIDSVEIDTTELLDNESSCNIFVDGTPNLAISIQERENKTITEPNSTLNFTVTCQNLSSPAFDSINVKTMFEGENIFSIAGVTGEQFINNLLGWKIPPLAHGDSHDKNFDMLIDKIAVADDYQIKITASVDTLEIDSREFLDNMASWQIAVNAMPIIKLGPISIQPTQPELRNIIRYSFPYSNDGNFPANNSIMTIEKSDFTYMLYYIRNNEKSNLTDTTVSSIEIPLGDIAPNFTENIIVGLRIYSYKQLPGNARSPLELIVKSRINFDSGEVSASRSDDVYYDVINSDLILDKNIVEPDKLPLRITFKSSDFGNVNLEIYNLAGEFIKTVYIGPVEKGDTYHYYWDGLNENGGAVSSGVYFVYAVSKFYNGYKKTIIVK